MSWDNNNLACILVFPPWQRKGLGSILMGVSYEISRREGILGGPEKPISELGRKGYKRFWAGEIARWLLGLEISSSSESESESLSVEAGMVDGEEEEEDDGDEEKIAAAAAAEDGKTVTGLVQTSFVDIQMCSKATWIVPEDCLLVLREMGVVEEARPGASSSSSSSSPVNTTAVTAATAAAAAAIPAEDAAAAAAAATTEEDVDEKRAAAAAKGVKKPVPRVRVDKAAVRRWVKANKIELERTCDPGGFLEGYAIKKAEDDADGLG